MIDSPLGRPRTSRDTLDASPRAGLTVFSPAGVLERWLENVAAPAGVWQGAQLLHFLSKAALLGSAARAAIAHHEDEGVPANVRSELPRINVCEGTDFPQHARQYYPRDLAPRVNIVRRIASAASRGGFRVVPLARFPKLAMARAFFAPIWNILFSDDHLLQEAERRRACRAIVRVGPSPVSGTRSA
jgi:hypothetical protein